MIQTKSKDSEEWKELLKDEYISEVKLPDSLLYLTCGTIIDVTLPERLKYLSCLNIKGTDLPNNLEVFICKNQNLKTCILI